ncbi:SDR family NAD(P)-dependent oxidoreductase [Ottowia sp. VDI28]|uniref:SDR family NAD(P)-dependent oxidoreductase n=1 Tax=Ottowia sp. VDI28 TaxID=3133968 RepID=UPI003C2B6832
MIPSEPPEPSRQRCALITGGTRHIGRAIALALAEEGLACTVVSRHFDDDARETIRMLEACGVPAAHAVADVTRPDAVKTLFAQTAARFGAVDVVVHCASMRGVAALADITLSSWREVMAVNLDAAFLCSQAALPHFPAQGGRIIYLSGAAAFHGVAHRAHVAASKAALLGLARALATELADLGITVNCISPGIIDTEPGPNAVKLAPHHQGLRIPAGRKGTPEEVAAVVRMLASEQGAYITGQVIHVNGGLYYG